jgi:hypothetical protein
MNYKDLIADLFVTPLCLSRRNGEQFEVSREILEEELSRLQIQASGLDLVRDRLQQVSQVACKEFWLGLKPGEAGQHDRWRHSLGASNFGALWVKFLYDDNRLPKRWLSGPRAYFAGLHPDFVKRLVICSLLIHDYGHLFFSHLLEEVLSDINWIPLDGLFASLSDEVLHQDLHDSTTPLYKSVSELFSVEVEQGKTIDECVMALEALILGQFGVPWIQTIVNSAVDADKIDYIRGDLVLLSNAGYPLRTRIDITTWLDEFLWDQYVNEHDLLCLPGRSALAAAHLWRERIFLYDNFYLAVDIRVADRVLKEIVQQFLIRCVMVDSFMNLAGQEFKELKDGPPPFGQWMNRAESQDGVDIIREKYSFVLDVLKRIMSSGVAGTSQMDYLVFQRMANAVLAHPALDERYRAMLETAAQELKKLQYRETDLRQLADKWVVGEPLVFLRKHAREVMEIARTFQYQYNNDVLIDVIVLPKVLATPRPRTYIRQGAGKPSFARIIVPAGPPSKWTPRS